MAVNLGSIKAKSVGGEILTAKSVSEYNDFDNPERSTRKPFDGAKIKKNTLDVKLPPMSIVTLELK